MPVVRRRCQQGGWLDLYRTQAKAQPEAIFDRFHLERGPNLATNMGSARAWSANTRVEPASAERARQTWRGVCS